MNKCDETCSCPLKETCLGRRFPEWSTIMREHWDSGNPVRQNHVIERSKYDYILPEPQPIQFMTFQSRDDHSNDPVRAPGLVTMAKSFIGTMAQEVKHVAMGGQATVSEETFQRRLAICRGEQGDNSRCRFLLESPRLRCLKCGCDGEIAFRLPVKTCPLGRWGMEP